MDPKLKNICWDILPELLNIISYYNFLDGEIILFNKWKIEKMKNLIYLSDRSIIIEVDARILIPRCIRNGLICISDPSVLQSFIGSHVMIVVGWNEFEIVM